MSGIHNKNLLFYSMHPTDAVSRKCLQELKAMPALDKQFVKICIHHPRDISQPPLIKLPTIVNECKQRGMMPILAVAGFSEPIFAGSALSWIKESSLNNSKIMASNINGTGVADNCSTIEQSSMNGNNLFDTDFNIGFSDGRGEFNKSYASIKESCESKIMTFDETTDKKQAASEIAQRLEQLKFSRNSEGNGPSRAPPGGNMNFNQNRSPHSGGNNMPPTNFNQQGASFGQQPGMPQMPPGFGQQQQRQPGMPPNFGQQPGMPQMPPNFGQQQQRQPGMPPNFGQQQQQPGMPQMPPGQQQRGLSPMLSNRQQQQFQSFGQQPAIPQQFGQNTSTIGGRQNMTMDQLQQQRNMQMSQITGGRQSYY